MNNMLLTLKTCRYVCTSFNTADQVPTSYIYIKKNITLVHKQDGNPNKNETRLKACRMILQSYVSNNPNIFPIFNVYTYVIAKS